VLLAVEAAPPPRLYVVTISSDGTFNSAGADIGARPCYLDLAVGNFDHMKPDPNPPPTNEHDPNLQFGLVTSDCGVSVRADMYDVNPQQGFPTPGQSFILPASLWSGFGGNGPTSIAGVALAAGDTQGRSLPLGRPSKVTITSHIQPEVGLNHPARWDWTKATQTAAFNPADQNSSTPQDQAFYHIKGYFITPADASGTGPQLTQVTTCSGSFTQPPLQTGQSTTGDGSAVTIDVKIHCRAGPTGSWPPEGKRCQSPR
jgi:hypothetical protein